MAGLTIWGERERFVEQVSDPCTGTCSTKLSLGPYGRAHNSLNKMMESKVVVQRVEHSKCQRLVF